VGQVTGTSSQADVPAVSGSNSGAEGLAGHFDGNVTINGILIASGAVPATGGIVGAVNSSSGAGVEGFSTAGHGVHGVNGAGSGFSPKFGCGVSGESENGYGVYGASKTASGVYGTSGPGHLAGEFAGNVSATGTLTANSTVTTFDIQKAGVCAQKWGPSPAVVAISNGSAPGIIAVAG
jgi:hypothetical protein